MQTPAIVEHLESQLTIGRWYSFSDIQSEIRLGETSVRAMQAAFNQLAGEPVSKLEDVVDGRSRPLNRILIPHVKSWLNSKRLKARILQVNMSSKSLALTDFRGHLQFIRLKSVDHESVQTALNQITSDLQLIPHADAHSLVQGLVLNSNLEILDALHGALEYKPDEPKSSVPASNSHLSELEQESIHIIREAAAAATKPGMLFSLGKDSMVMFRLAQKAFAPEPIPFPLVNIDTRWKFQEMNEFREWIKARTDVATIHYVNPEAIEGDVNPFDNGSAGHTEITKTKALKRLLDEYGFDFVFGGARRDEEKSRAKERVFSVRDQNHGWDPRNQRPELWNVYNTTLVQGQSMRVFPLSNWTELDIWRYLHEENIPMVPLYFAKRRPFVKRNGALIMVDDDRFRLEPNEQVYFERIRFRSLGCYPLSGGVQSDASNLEDIIHELESTRVSERSSRVIDFDRGASMEQKKKEGYF